MATYLFLYPKLPLKEYKTKEYKPANVCLSSEHEQA